MIVICKIKSKRYKKIDSRIFNMLEILEVNYRITVSIHQELKRIL